MNSSVEWALASLQKHRPNPDLVLRVSKLMSVDSQSFYSLSPVAQISNSKGPNALRPNSLGLDEGQSSDGLAELVRFLYSQPTINDINRDLEKVLRSAADSRFSERDWAEGLVVMLVHVRSARLSSNLDKILGYMHCCESSNETNSIASAGERLSGTSLDNNNIGRSVFAGQLISFLAIHGFENL
jgi:hypothetical protein